jgi:hypothetical protein
MLQHLAIWQQQTHLAVLQGSKKSCMRMKVLLPLHQFPHTFAITYCRKKYSQILSGQTLYLCTLITENNYKHTTHTDFCCGKNTLHF